VYSVAFNRPVNHTFLREDFNIEVKPPAINLAWTVTNNPSDRRQLAEMLTSLVYVNIVSGEWQPTAVFGISFSSSSPLKDEFGNSLPVLNFTAAPPIGPEPINSSDSGGNTSGIPIKVVAIVVGCVGGVLVVCVSIGSLYICLRLRKRAKIDVKEKYEEVPNNSSHSNMSLA
jgi:hypothetical protein